MRQSLLAAMAAALCCADYTPGQEWKHLPRFAAQAEPDPTGFPPRREPVYATAQPRYCLLVLGAEARSRVWLVLDGDHLYVDRNGNGDLTEAGEQVQKYPGPAGKVGLQAPRWLPREGKAFAAGDLTEADGKTRHTHLWVRQVGEFMHVSILIQDRHYQYTGNDAWSFWDRPTDLRFADRPADAPIIHLNGPLSMKLHGEPLAFSAGKDARIEAVVGTPGRGPGTFAIFKPDFQTLTAQPRVQVEFNLPGVEMDASASPLRTTWVHQTVLQPDSCCIIYSYVGSVRVPAQAGPAARITLSFPAWPGTKVRPTVIEARLR